MKRLIPYIAFVCLTGFSATRTVYVMAGGCSSQINKTAKIDCSEDEMDCQKEKAENFDLNITSKS